MKISKEISDATVLEEIGRRLAQIRLRQNLTQAQLAEKADVAKRTVERLESGSVAPQLAGFIRICRALDLVERFELLVPEREAQDSPGAVKDEAGGGQRRRASTARGAMQLGGGAERRTKDERKMRTEPSRVTGLVVADGHAVPSVVVIAHELN